MATMTMLPTAAHELHAPAHNVHEQVRAAANEVHAPDPRAFTVDCSKAEQLKAVFPDVELDVLTQLLAFHDNDMEAVIDLLLDVGIVSNGPDGGVGVDGISDAEMARHMQQETDEQIARALDESIQHELAAQVARAAGEVKATQPTPAATRTVSNASLRARKFLMQRMRPSRSQIASTTTRLLDPADTPSAAGAGEGSYDLTPLQDSSYTPPAMATDASTSSDEGSARVAPQLSTTAAALYNSRLDRARSSNRVRRADSGRLAQQPSAQLAPLQGLVPEGELI